MKKSILIMATFILLSGCADKLNNSDSDSDSSSETAVESTSGNSTYVPGRIVGDYPLIPGVPSEVTFKDVKYQYAWSDEFEGDQINQQYWTYDIGDGQDNKELQYYLGTYNTTLENGIIKLIAKKEQYLGYNYTSARLNSRDKVYFKYGYVQAYMKIPSFTGAWPAFWMLGQSYSRFGWPRCGEIDIMEAVNADATVHSTLHYGTTHMQKGIGKHSFNNAAARSNWHLFEMVWNEDCIRTYVDGTNYGFIDLTPAAFSAFHAEFYFIINLAVGGEWPSNNIDESKLPSNFELDYIRVYQI